MTARLGIFLMHHDRLRNALHAVLHGDRGDDTAILEPCVVCRVVWAGVERLLA